MPDPTAQGVRPCAIMLYSKRGRCRYLSHLDVARAVDRAVRRAGLPVAYSQGFHPQAQISFGPPPPLGMEALGEPCCLDLQHPAPAVELIRALARQMPADLALVSLQTAWRGRRSPLADLQQAGYEAHLAPEADLEGWADATERLRAAGQWLVTRQTKRQQVTVDLLPGLRVLELRPAPAPVLYLELSLAPATLVKPAEVLQALAELTGRPAVPVGRWVRTFVR